MMSAVAFPVFFAIFVGGLVTLTTGAALVAGLLLMVDLRSRRP